MAKQTRGRQKVDMKTIADENKRHVTFSKRRTGLFNKAAEINILTGAETAAIVFSRHGKAYTFQTPGAKSLVENFFVDRNNYLAPVPPADGHCGELQCLKEALSRHEEDKELYEMSSTMMKGDSGGGRGSLGLGFWWDRPIETMEMGELEMFKEALVKLRKKVAERAESMLKVRKATPFMSMTNNGGTLVGFGDQEIGVEDYLVDGCSGGGGQAVDHGPTHLPSS